MKSSLPKVLHPVAGRPIIEYVLRVAESLSPATTTLVVGHMKDTLQQGLAAWPGLRFVVQEPQLGTGHALLQTAPVLEHEKGVVLLLSGDVPLLRRHTLAALLTRHQASGAAATVLTAVVEQPYGYGRIVRTKGKIARIVEERDASPAQRKINTLMEAMDFLGVETFVSNLQPRPERTDCRKIFHGEADGLCCRCKATITKLLLQATLALGHEQFGR